MRDVIEREIHINVPGIANDPRFGGRLSLRDRLWSEGSDPRG